MLLLLLFVLIVVNLFLKMSLLNICVLSFLILNGKSKRNSLNFDGFKFNNFNRVLMLFFFLKILFLFVQIFLVMMWMRLNERDERKKRDRREGRGKRLFGMVILFLWLRWWKYFSFNLVLMNRLKNCIIVLVLLINFLMFLVFRLVLV